jgi:hypothetical protein
MAAKRRIWTAAILVVAVGTAAGLVAWRKPLLLPGNHTASVYAVDEAISKQVEHAPGFFGRLLGQCDADTAYVEDGDTKMCLVLSGPLGRVQVRRDGSTVVVTATGAAELKAMAGQDTGAPGPTTRLVLKTNGRPVAIVPVAGLTEGRPARVNLLD